MAIEHVVKSKTGTIFVNEDILEEYSLKICKIDPYFREHYEKKKKKKKIQVNSNGQKYILFRIDIYFTNFTKYFLAKEIDEKGHTDRDLELEDEIEKLKLQLANLGIKNNDVNNKK